MKFLIRLVLLLSFVLNTAYSQEEGGQSDALLQDSIKDVYTVVGIGIGGAVLGLSTLSFAEQPKDKLKNIVIGGAIGVILGVGVVAYKHATKTQTVYEEYSLKDFNTNLRLTWHESNFENYKDPNSPSFTYQFTF